jgi:hypothetical protein
MYVQKAPDTSTVSTPRDPLYAKVAALLVVKVALLEVDVLMC